MLIKFLDGSERDVSSLLGADLRKSDLRWASLRGCNLSGSDLRESDLRWANLSRSDLSKSDLRGCNLSRSDLSKSDLRGCNLRGCNLRWCNLSGANLSGASLQNAKTDLTIVSVDGIGSAQRKTTYCKESDRVWCGCFTGTLEEFEAEVSETHKDNPKFLGQYLAAIAFFRSAAK